MTNKHDAVILGCEATYKAAWANEIVYMCDKHMEGLVYMGMSMGSQPVPLPCGPGHNCQNCLRELRKEQTNG